VRWGGTHIQFPLVLLRKLLLLTRPLRKILETNHQMRTQTSWVRVLSYRLEPERLVDVLLRALVPILLNPLRPLLVHDIVDIVLREYVRLGRERWPFKRTMN
jgi:hypothetical protein